MSAPNFESRPAFPATAAGKTDGGVFPVTYEDVIAARERLRPFLQRTPVRTYAPLDAEVSNDIRIYVKHENHNPTNSFKVRSALAAMTALSPAARAGGVVAASRGNHGLGLAYAGQLLNSPVTVCVPIENNPEKNAALRGFGVHLVEQGLDYDDAVAVAERIARKQGVTLIHASNNRSVLAGAGTLTAELLEDVPELQAIVLAVGSSSHATAALAVVRAVRPEVRVFAVQAEGAATTYLSWKAGRVVRTDRAVTFADGIATRSASPFTLDALRIGLAGFVTVTDAQIAMALRLTLRTTHNLCEGAGAVGLAGLLALREELSGSHVAVVMTGANIDESTLQRVISRQI